ncbi:MAG: hypothetical protein V3S69_07990 [Dehalococcoidales bacterium]
MNKLEKVWDDIENGPDDKWDDWFAWSTEDFMSIYDLPEHEAVLLWQVVQSRTDVRRNVTMKRPSRVGTMINEALHQSLDGWTVEQGLIIQAFLSDIAWAVSQIEEDERMAKIRREETHAPKGSGFEDTK